jgi:mRNA interferase MazF
MMVDKITTMPRENLRNRLGRISDADVLALGRSLVVFLGLAG